VTICVRKARRSRPVARRKGILDWLTGGVASYEAALADAEQRAEYAVVDRNVEWLDELAAAAAQLYADVPEGRPDLQYRAEMLGVRIRDAIAQIGRRHPAIANAFTRMRWSGSSTSRSSVGRPAGATRPSFRFAGQPPVRRTRAVNPLPD
jgi:hypothetical protein